MSGQWEVVGKKKDKSSKIPSSNTLSNKEQNKKKQSINLNVKIQDVLPKSQVKNLYSSGKNKENIQVDNVSVSKKPQKKPQEAPSKPKPFKSIESALNSINVDEFKSVFDKSKAQFPGAPIVWLKELVQYVNQKVSVEVPDPIFATKPQNYPLTALPTPMRNVIESATKEAGPDNLLVFFDSALTSIATDMAKNSTAIGQKIVLQYLASTYPRIATTNMTKHMILRNSYQNRPNVGLSILWVLGQAGYGDFTIGLKIFNEFMFPLIDLRHYTRFVIQYLIDIVTSNEIVRLTNEEYLKIVQIAYEPNKKHPPNDLKGLNRMVEMLASKMFNPKQNREKFEFFLKTLHSIHNKNYHNSISETLIDCFVQDHNTLGTWVKLYSSNIPSSAILLHYIEHNWKTVSLKINRKELFNTIAVLTSTNGELLMRKKKEDGLNESADALKKLTQKMTSKTKGRSSYRWFVFFLTITTISLLYIDVKQKGSWQDSHTRKTLNEWGVIEQTHKAFNKTKQGLFWLDGKIEQTLPGYHQTVADLAEPYQELSRNLALIIYNLVQNLGEAFIAKYPEFVKSVEDTVPELVETGQNAARNVWSTSVAYLAKSVDYLRNEVFVGNLSPENMQRVVIEAFNTTQIKAAEYYHWLCDKVQTTMK